MVATPSLLDAAKQLKPLQQGDRDGLCGLYAIINAIQLVLYPRIKLDRVQTKSLFIHGVHFLAQADALLDVIEVGIGEVLWAKLCRELTLRASRVTGVTIKMRFLLRGIPRLTTEKAVSIIGEALAHGNPVMMVLWGIHDHLTVAAGISGDRLILFDSCHLQWINIASLELYSARAKKAHQIMKSSAVALSVVGKPQTDDECR